MTLVVSTAWQFPEVVVARVVASVCDNLGGVNFSEGKKTISRCSFISFSLLSREGVMKKDTLTLTLSRQGRGKRKESRAFLFVIPEI